MKNAFLAALTVSLLGCPSPHQAEADLSLTFNERVSRAVEIVDGKYPEAKLYEADGTADSPTSKPSGIDHLRVVFDGGENNTVIITEKAVGVFGKPELIPHPWCEDVVIEWPIDMDLSKANELKEAAGYTDPYGAVTLRNPLGPTLENPSFIFGGDPTQPYIWVDTVTGKVTGPSE